MKVSRRRFLQMLGGTIAAGGFAAATGYHYAAFIEPERLTYQQQIISLPGLHPSLEGFRLVQLSDFHYSEDRNTLAYLQHVVSQANSLQPDLIVLTGDFVDSNLDGLPDLIKTLAELKAKWGVYAVLGNHDHRRGASAVRHGLEEVGIKLLWNENVTLTGDAAALSLIGLDDWLRGRPQIRPALDSLPAHTTNILLVHEPDVADIICRYPQFHLQLSGHSHGGQIRLPLLGPLILPVLGQKYDQGYYQVEGLHLYTSRGVGTLSDVPFRFNCPPELTELILVRG
jgi:predicted MPP superfamily phosphohydrolase